MKCNDAKIYKSLLVLLAKKEKITVSSVARHANVERSSVYYRLNNLVS